MARCTSESSTPTAASARSASTSPRREGREILYALARTSDVFLTNFLPERARKLRIDVADVRAVNPQIIYVRGTAFGARGPEAQPRRIRHDRILVPRAAARPA